MLSAFVSYLPLGVNGMSAELRLQHESHMYGLIAKAEAMERAGASVH